MSETRKVLEFGTYDKSAVVKFDEPESWGPLLEPLKYMALLACLDDSAAQPGSKDDRRKLKEIRRRFRKIGEKTETGRRLDEAGGSVALTQSELDMLSKKWADFATKAQLDVEISTVVDDFLENAPTKTIEPTPVAEAPAAS